MPPKRKAPNDANHAAAAEFGASPTPRKKTKAEAKAAAREWAENRRKKSAPAASASASVSMGESVLQNAPSSTADEKIAANGGTTTSPTPRKKSKAEALAAARAWHDNRNHQTTASSVGASSPPPTANKTQKTDHVTRSSGGNAFLKSVRTEVVTGVATKKEDPPPAVPESIQPTSSSALKDRSNAPSPSIVAPSKPKSTLKSYIGKILRCLLFSSGLALNVVAIVGIVKHQSSSYDEFERQNKSDVSKLSAAVSKSIELEAVLRSGVLVLEEKVQRMRQTVGIGNEGGEHALQYVQAEEDDDADLLVREEKQNLQDALSILEEQLRDDQLH